eukprot:3780828-Pyramimonas_sp.AAC.1
MPPDPEVLLGTSITIGRGKGIASHIAATGHVKIFDVANMMLTIEADAVTSASLKRRMVGILKHPATGAN